MCTSLKFLKEFEDPFSLLAWRHADRRNFDQTKSLSQPLMKNGHMFCIFRTASFGQHDELRSEGEHISRKQQMVSKPKHPKTPCYHAGINGQIILDFNWVLSLCKPCKNYVKMKLTTPGGTIEGKKHKRPQAELQKNVQFESIIPRHPEPPPPQIIPIKHQTSEGMTGCLW